MDKQNVSVSEYLREMYKTLDKVAVERIASLGGATCKKGCADCCMLLTAIPIADGLNIAEDLLQRPNWKDYVEKMAKVGGMLDYEGVSQVTWFEKKVQCPLLNDDKTCSVYERRPAACRFHAVQSPAESCSPDAPQDTTTKIIYLQPLEDESWKISKLFQKQVPEVLGSEALIAAPIPIMVLFAMLLVSGDEPETARYIGERANHYKVLPPYPWLMTHGPSMASLQKRANNSIREQLEAQGIPPPDIMVRK